MHRSSLLLFAAILLSTAGAIAQQGPTLTIDLAQVKAKASPQLYGLMTEEINYSYDGGLYAELVRNRTFQDRGKIPPNWFLYEWGSADASMAIDRTTGPSAALPLSLQLTVKSAGDRDQAGISNLGYWGFPVRPQTTYHGSFYAKTSDPSIGSGDREPGRGRNRQGHQHHRACTDHCVAATRVHASFRSCRQIFAVPPGALGG